MSLLFETIRIENGILLHPLDHEERMHRSRIALLGAVDRFCLPDIVVVPGEYATGTVRCRIGYGLRIETIEFSHYVRRPLKTFQVVTSDKIEYPFKYSDRSALETLLKKKGNADDIIIVKNGMITDTSFSNLIFFDGSDWFTPTTPLLRGTCRERLIGERKILERKISPDELFFFRGFKIINAMNDPGDMEMLPVTAISLP